MTKKITILKGEFIKVGNQMIGTCVDLVIDHDTDNTEGFILIMNAFKADIYEKESVSHWGMV